MSLPALMALADCCEIVSGATPSTSVDDYWDGEICWATPKDLSDLDGHYISDTPRKLTKEGLNSCAATILPPNSVLFSSRAPIGHVAVNTVPMATNQGFKSFVPKAGIVEAKFLFHWLRANRAFLESLGVGATFKEVSKAIVARIQIPLPPLPEQRRIAAILDKADALRAKRRAALAELDSLAQSMLVDLLDSSHACQDVSLEKLVIDMHQGINTVTEAIEYKPSGFPIIQSKNTTQGYLDLNDVRFVDAVTFGKYSEKYKPKKDDLLLCNIGTIGSSILVKEDIDFLIAWNIFLIKVNSNLAEPVYIKNFLDRLFRAHYFDKFLTGGTVKFISKKTLSATQITLPSIAEQREFVRLIDEAERIRSSMLESLIDLDALFTSLQHRAFRGEL